MTSLPEPEKTIAGPELRMTITAFAGVVASRAQQSYDVLLVKAAPPDSVIEQFVSNVQVSLTMWTFLCCVPAALYLVCRLLLEKKNFRIFYIVFVGVAKGECLHVAFG